MDVRLMLTEALRGAFGNDMGARAAYLAEFATDRGVARWQDLDATQIEELIATLEREVEADV